MGVSTCERVVKEITVLNQEELVIIGLVGGGGGGGGGKGREENIFG